MTQILPSQTPGDRAKAVTAAVDLLRKGETVALPTETVYGLAADALNSDSIAKIFEAKARPRFDPLIVHLPNYAWLDRVASVAPESRELLEGLVAQFWPGPLTIVLPRREIIPEIATAGLDTIAVRMSGHPLFREIIGTLDSPLAAPSANRFGRVSPTTAQHVFEELEGRVSLIVDAGACQHGIESTIIAVRNGGMDLLRPGPITIEELAGFGRVEIAKASPRPEAPGQLPSHYAPSTPLVITEDPAAFPVPSNKKYGLLAWSPVTQAGQFAEVRQLSSGQNLREAAANLFRYLREMDSLDLDLLVAERLPESGLGTAIMDRLRRASSEARTL